MSLRKMWSWAFVAILIAGNLYASEAARPITVNAGESFTVSVPSTTPETVAKCSLTTPDEEIIELIPNNDRNDKYVLDSDMPFSGCAVIVKNADSKDNGYWELISSESGGATRSSTFVVTVNGVSADAEEEAQDDENVKMLTPINYVARVGLNITVTLSKLAYIEDCYLRTPEGNILRADGDANEGVNFYGTSNFVSCRVVIGPMDQSLLGNWALCGKYTANNNQYERCQPANINWNNNNNPDQLWHAESRPVFDHVVNFDGTLTPAVRGTGTINTCHIITPSGEDLVITPESDYPHIKRAENEASICSVAIGPIEGSLLGEWVIYGTFSSFSIGFNEVRLPMNLHLYDEDDPYSQAYNVTTLPEAYHLVNLGNTIEMQVAGSGTTDGCYVKTPSGETYDQTTAKSANGVSFVDVDSLAACRLAVGPIFEEMLGDWELTGKFTNNGLYTEIKQSFTIIREDPANPVEEPNRSVVNVTEEFINTRLGDTHRVALNIDLFSTRDSCHIRTPAGLQYKIMDGFSVPGIKEFEASVTTCAVSFTISEDLIGEWTLISRETRTSTPIERRLPFTIYVEEQVNALPSEANIAEGNDLYVRLEYPTDVTSSCKLVPPYKNGIFNIERDENYVDTCGFIVKNVTVDAEGKWEIVYGNSIIYRAPTTITILERWIAQETTLIWIRDKPVEEVMGPEDAVYCRIEDPSGLVVFEGFGRCYIDMERVRSEHEGEWKMTVGSPGRVLTVENKFLVKVNKAESKPLVITNVEQNKPSVMLRCSVPIESNVTACKFRKPDGQVLLASHGVGEDRYSFHGVGVSLQSEVQKHECGLRITNPVVADLGLWRCAVDTETETYYGFLSVLSSWAMRDPEVAAMVETEPTLRASAQSVDIMEDESLTMTCSIQSAIQYCYFRAQNGTVFNVGPGSTSPSYVGAGFDAGECGIRFPSLGARDSGAWSCHVGFSDNKPEQRARFNVTVSEAMVMSARGSWPGRISFEAIVYQQRPLDYCRFVRIDGFGFTMDNLPTGYSISSNAFVDGRCELTVANPTVPDVHPWTVVARVTGQDVEIVRVTPHFFGNPPGFSRSNFALVWSVILLFTLTLFVIGMMMGTAKNRNWTTRGAVSVRNSFRNSFSRFQTKPTLPVQNENNTAFAA